MRLPKTKIIRIFSHALLAGVLSVCLGGGVLAQEAVPAPSNLFQTKAIAAGATRLRTETETIELWGVMVVEGAAARQRMKARMALANMVGNEAVHCELKERTPNSIKAQCVNSGEIDLGLYMLQNGLAMVDRAAVYGTPFEEPYISAEQQAEQRGAGFWAVDEGGSGGGASDDLLYIVMGILGGVILLLGVLTAAMITGFRKLASGQDKNLEFLNKERELKNKERKIVAAMLDAELRANKSKIEAYLVIYEEMLKGLREPDKAPQYTKAGDIVQMQPALDRSVFDRNTDKMDLLGRKLSSEVIHFYARIKSNPDYVNLEPDMPPQEALGIAEQAVKNAQVLDEILKKILEHFAKAGVGNLESV